MELHRGHRRNPKQEAANCLEGWRGLARVGSKLSRCVGAGKRYIESRACLGGREGATPTLPVQVPSTLGEELLFHRVEQVRGF